MRPVLLGREGWRGEWDWWGEESGCGLGVSSFLAFSLLLLFSGQTRRRKGVWDGACVCVSDCVKRHWRTDPVSKLDDVAIHHYPLLSLPPSLSSPSPPLQPHPALLLLLLLLLLLVFCCRPVHQQRPTHPTHPVACNLAFSILHRVLPRHLLLVGKDGARKAKK